LNLDLGFFWQVWADGLDELLNRRITKEELRKEDERLNRIREVSADFLLALKNLR
jgi:hypothetical protein